MITPEQLARIRFEGHKRYGNSQTDRIDEDIIGAAGEIAFAKRYNLTVDTSFRPHGDYGVDFELELLGYPCKIDVKTYKKPNHLLATVAEIYKGTMIYVLAGYNDDTTVDLIGWEYRAILRRAPTKDFGLGTPSHYIHRDKLRPIHQLDMLIRSSYIHD
jgi:hypothetical protein